MLRTEWARALFQVANHRNCNGEESKKFIECRVGFIHLALHDRIQVDPADSLQKREPMATRPPQKRREDIFFLAFVFLLLMANFIGFARTYYLAGMFRAPLPSRLVHIHGALFTSWLLLLLLQTSLIVGGRIRWHRQLGVLAGVIAALMLIVGPLVLIAALRRHAFPSNAADLIFAADLGGLALFALFVASGLRFRNNIVVHKRLMLFATIAILPPGLDRWSFSFMESSFAFFGIYLAFPFAIIVYDLFSVRKVHRVTLLCSVLITAYIFGAGRLSKTSIWHRVTESVQETSSLQNR